MAIKQEERSHEKSIPCVCLLPLSCPASPIEVDLTTFSQDLSGTGLITVAPDGSSAVLEASGFYNSGSPLPGDDTFAQGSARLYDDSLSIPSNALTIQFGYNVDLSGFRGLAPPWPTFHAGLYDSGGPISPYTLDLGGTGSWTGTVNWDISGASFVPGTVGLEFSVAAGYTPDPGGVNEEDAWAAISDVLITTSEPPEPPPTQPVPEASTLMLFGSALPGLAFFARRRKLLRS